MPRVASETSALLPPLHNNHAGARHRTPRGESGEAASPFALLLDSADATPAKEPGRRAPENQSAQSPDQSPRTRTTQDQSDKGASEAPSDAPQASRESQAAGDTKPDAPDAECPEDTAAADLLDASLAADAGIGPQPVPPAVVVSVDVTLAAQGAAEGDSTATAGIMAPPANPAIQLAAADAALAANQPAPDSQAPTPEQAATAQAAGDKATLAVNGEAAAPPDQQTAMQASNDPALKETGKPAAEASKPLNVAQPQATDTRGDAAIVKHPTPPPNSSPIEARRSDAATDGEGDDDKPTDATGSADPTAADRPVRGPHRAHTDALAIDDKERQPLGAEIRDAAHSAKPPTEAVHAVLLANDQAASAAQPAATSGNQNAEPAIPIAGLAVEIAARAQAGQNRFEIRLDPPELGRIDVRLDIDRSGQVTSRLVVERPETLDQLRRDSAGLERALQDAGLKTAQNGLQFSLRDQGFAGRDHSNPSSDAARLVVPDPDLAPVEIPTNAYGPHAADQRHRHSRVRIGHGHEQRLVRKKGL